MAPPKHKRPSPRPGRRPKNLYVVGLFAFVPHPIFHGLWVRTDHCVVKVACTVCESAIGVPCATVARDGKIIRYGSGTHYVRRGDASRLKYPKGEKLVITSKVMS